MIFRKNFEKRTAGQNNIDVYLRIGDSMEGGAASDASIDAEYLGDKDNVLIYYKGDLTTTDNGAWETFNGRSNNRPGLARPNTPNTNMGVEYSFAHELNENGNSRKKAILKLGVGGAFLIPASTSPNDWTRANNELYPIYFRDFFRRSINKLIAAGYHNPQFKAVIIRLGTNDVFNGVWNSATFTTAVQNLIANIREELGMPTLPVYWVQVRADLYVINPANRPQANVDACRAVLESFELGGSAPISGFTLLNYDSDGLQADGIHVDANANISQGINEANLVLAL